MPTPPEKLCPSATWATRGPQLKSSAIFSRCRTEGALSARAKFQVSLPTPYNVIDQRVVRTARVKVEAILRGRRLLRGSDAICAAIPDQLAIQLGMCARGANLGRRRSHWFMEPEPEDVQAPDRACSAIPLGVELGIHLCYGELNHQHIEPSDTTLMTRLSNQMAKSFGHINWISMPVPRGAIRTGVLRAPRTIAGRSPNALSRACPLL